MREEKATVNLTVTATPGPSGSVEDIQYVLSETDNAGYLDGQTIDFVRKDWKKKADIVFTLSDQSGHQLAFPNKAEEAFWAHWGDCCPKEPGSGRGEIKGASVDSTGKVLTVENMNSKKDRLTYVLRMTSNGSKECTAEFDPVIENRGG